MPDEHSLLSPSSAYQWIACPPSIKASEGQKDTAGRAAEEGTVAHSLCEFLLNESIKGNIDPDIPAEITDSEYYCADMLENCNVYVTQVTNYYRNYKKNCKLVDIYVESRVDLGEYVPASFGTADCIIIADSVMDVFDFKYGKGLEVSAVNNPQMRLYALGSYELYGWLTGVKCVTTHIVQPRIGNTATHESLGIKALKQWGNEVVKPAAKLAATGDGEFCAGSHCVFCKIRTTCRARALHYLNELPQGVPNKNPTMGAYELERLLPMLKGIKDWAQETSETCLEMALRGTKFEGFKLVEGRGRRIITDMDKMKKALLKDKYSNIFKPEELRSLTDLEKMVGKKAFNTKYGDLIVKQAGAPTLAPNSDKRAEIIPDTPEDDFNDILKLL